MEHIKRNLPLTFALALPVFMVFFIAGAIYLPALFNKPQYNFLYMTGYDYCGTQYFVRNNKLIKQDGDCKNYYPQPKQEYKLYLYDIKLNTNKQLSFEETQSYTLDTNSFSPDGYKVEYGTSSSGFFPFFAYSGSDYNTRYLQGHGTSYKLNLRNDGAVSMSQFQFLGWIAKRNG